MSSVALKGKKAEAQALDFTRGQGDQRRTYYKCGVLETARKEGRALRIIGKDGNFKLTTPDRMVHREQLDDQYGESHALNGHGKYITNDAIQTKHGKKVVVGAQNVNPYLAEERSYHTLVQAFHYFAKGSIENMVANFAKDRINGQHLIWQGKPTIDDAVAVSKWVTEDDLWTIACKLNPLLVSVLRKSKSQIADCRKHENARTKFHNNLGVIRRARQSFRVATGEIMTRGGETPYGVPLEQCGFAIDMFYLTTGEIDGEEIGSYHYRMAYGRSIPWTLYQRDWIGMSQDNKIAYLNEDVRNKVK